MQVTVFSLAMAVIWSSVLIVTLYFFRSKLLISEAISVNGIIMIYFFCAIRMFVPLEFPWAQVVDGGIIWDRIYLIMKLQIVSVGIMSLSVLDFLLLIWFVGALKGIVRIIVNYKKTILYMEKITYESELIEQSDNGVEIIRTPFISSPCSVGIIRKKILLPNANYTEKAYENIVAHESVHHHNNDLLTKLLINIFCALFWWNPIVFFLKKDLYQTMEIRCDLAVVEKMNNQEKAEYLSEILEEFKGITDLGETPDYVIAFNGDKSGDELVERFNMVSKYSQKSSFWRKGLIFCLAMMIFVCSYSFLIQSYFECNDLPNYEEGIYLEPEDSYVIEKKDGEYVLICGNEKINIEKTVAENLIKDGFLLKVE